MTGEPVRAQLDGFGQYAAAGAVFTLLGLALMLKPRHMCRPHKWEFRNAERVEPSDVTVAITCVTGLVFTIAGIAFLVAAFRQ